MDESLFTEEQIEELNEISQLSEEEQKKVLPDFLKKLSPEQLNALKQSQPSQCPFCLIAEGKIKAKKIYEDDELIAALEINPASLGHTIVFPKKHVSVLAQLKDVSNLFNKSNKIASVLFETLKAQGTNILVSNGPAAGQIIPHLVVEIIPRFDKDKISFNLPRKKASEGELDKLLSSLKGKLVAEKRDEKPKPQPIKVAKKQERIP